MKTIAPICRDMIEIQNQLQRVYRLERNARKRPEVAAAVPGGVQVARVINGLELQFLSTELSIHPAANERYFRVIGASDQEPAL